MRIYEYLVPWEIVIICNTHQDSKWNKIFVFDATQNILLGKHKKMSCNMLDLVKDLHNNQCAVRMRYNPECLKPDRWNTTNLRRWRLYQMETSTDPLCLEQCQDVWPWVCWGKTIWYLLDGVSRTYGMYTHLFSHTETSLLTSTLCDPNRSCDFCSAVNLTIALATALQHTTQTRNSATAASKRLTIWHNQNALHHHQLESFQI